MTSDSTACHIFLDEVDVVRDGVCILSKISLRVARQQILSVVGRNGSGKTTLLELLAGRIQPSSGRYETDALNLHSEPSIFYAPQGPYRALLPHSYAFDNIALGAIIRGESRQRRLTIARQALSTLGLNDEPLLTKRAKYLSGGEQQVVLVARLLAELADPLLRPQLVLLDELFSALDVRARLHTALIVRAQLRSVGTTGVVVSHDLDEATMVSDRIVVLGSKPGKVVATIDVPIADPRHEIRGVSEKVSIAVKQRVVEELATTDHKQS